MATSARALLVALNKTYLRLHKTYEDLFWISYMGDHSVNKKKDEALAKRDAFRADPKHIRQINEAMADASNEEKRRLELWLRFFNCYQSPKEALSLKNKINRLESALLKKRSTRKEGYIDPKTRKFVLASINKMTTMMKTNDDEAIRKACFKAREKLAVQFIDEYIELVKLRNQYAQKLGYSDFYDFKVQREDGMTKKELFGIFDDIYRKTKYAFADIRKLEKKMPGLRKPWNFSYMMSGDFIKEEDQYFQFDEALMRWGRSFAALGINFKGAALQLDLLDRKGKWNNGFCHWPDLVHFKSGKRMPGSSNFTCNVVFGQVGSGFEGYHTLFHEGGHAAHMLNIEQADVCVGHEYAPMSMSWAETQSMFMDTMFAGIGWRTRYAINSKGQSYPLDLFKRKIKRLSPLRPRGLNGVIGISDFERNIYEEKNLTREKVKSIAKRLYKKYGDYSENSLGYLNVPHIYSWESSGSYHGYGLAEIALKQWMNYFYKKYGYIVDNPKVGQEMAKVWKLGASKTFKEFVPLAVGQKLNAKAILDDMTASAGAIIKKEMKKVECLKKVRSLSGPVRLNAIIRMVEGKKKIADNRKSFEDMAKRYKKWLTAKLIS